MINIGTKNIKDINIGSKAIGKVYVGSKLVFSAEEPIIYTVASGGVITTSGDYKVHRFTGSGTFVVSQVGTDNAFEYLVVAGGGKGGRSGENGLSAGGAGAGGMLEGTRTNITTGSYSVVVGAGSTIRSSTAASRNSSVFSITATGGGNGQDTYSNFAVVNGGSGGGGGANSTEVISNGGTGISGQGNNGAPLSGGGTGTGGGKNGAGVFITSVPLNTIGGGGAGKSNSITGTAVTYAKGGDISRINSTYTPANATANTGNGGDGGKRLYGSGGIGANGGSGVVIIKYKYK